MQVIKSANKAAGPPSPRLGDVVYRRTRQLIIDGTLAARTFVRETDLARQFGVSRTPLREALRQLQAEGLLTPVERGGYVVSDLGPGQLSDAYAVRGVLDGLAAELAAAKRRRVDLAVLADLLDELDAALNREDDAELSRLNRLFHDSIASVSRNEFLQPSLANIRDLFDSFRTEAVRDPVRRAAAHAEHHALYEAIQAQDAEGAARLARQHVSSALEFRLSRGDSVDQDASV
jgi:DNA-binding GntR family transcriptional regulator